ncbi:MAG: DMT family transporter [Candidatus Njordarchaeum guaymaensis]
MLGYIYAVALAFIWSIAAIFYRYAVREGNVKFVTLIRIYPAFLVTIIGVNLLDKLEIYHLSNPLVLSLSIITGACGILLGSYAYIYAIKHAGIAITYPIAFSYPVYVSIIATALMGEKVTIGLVSGLILQVTWIVLIAYNSNNYVNKSDMNGVIAAIIASLSWAIQAILIKIALYSVTPVLFAFDRLLVTSILTLPLLLKEIYKEQRINKNETIASMIGGTLGIGVAIILYHLAINDTGVARTALVSSSSPALSIFFALLILKERPSFFSSIGSLISNRLSICSNIILEKTLIDV